MSEQNIALHNAAVAAVREGRVPEELLAPGFLIENRVSAVTDYTYHGVVGWRDWVNDVFETFGRGASYEVEEIIDSGEDFVVASFCLTGTGARSKLPLEFRWVGVTWFRGGQVIRAVGFPDREEALQAARGGS